MDPLGLLLDIVAVAIYPGGLFLAALALITQRAGALPRGGAIDVRALGAIIAATLAASMASLPGSPAASLPPPGGATPNLAAGILLLFVAGSLAAQEPWSIRRVALSGFGGAALILLGLVAASFSVATIAGAAGGEAAAARILAAATVLVALPLIVQPHAESAGAMGRLAVTAASLEVVLALLVPPSLHWPATVIAVGAVVGGVVVYGLLLRAARAATRREYPALIALAGACCAAATVVAVLATRP
jgi:hypothetical protein